MSGLNLSGDKMVTFKTLSNNQLELLYLISLDTLLEIKGWKNLYLF